MIGHKMIRISINGVILLLSVVVGSPGRAQIPTTSCNHELTGLRENRDSNFVRLLKQYLDIRPTSKKQILALISASPIPLNPLPKTGSSIELQFREALQKALATMNASSWPHVQQDMAAYADLAQQREDDREIKFQETEIIGVVHKKASATLKSHAASSIWTTTVGKRTFVITMQIEPVNNSLVQYARIFEWRYDQEGFVPLLKVEAEADSRIKFVTQLGSNEILIAAQLNKHAPRFLKYDTLQNQSEWIETVNDPNFSAVVERSEFTVDDAQLAFDGSSISTMRVFVSTATGVLALAFAEGIFKVVDFFPVSISRHLNDFSTLSWNGVRYIVRSDSLIMFDARTQKFKELAQIPFDRHRLNKRLIAHEGGLYILTLNDAFPQYQWKESNDDTGELVKLEKSEATQVQTDRISQIYWYDGKSKFLAGRFGPDLYLRSTNTGTYIEVPLDTNYVQIKRPPILIEGESNSSKYIVFMNDTIHVFDLHDESMVAAERLNEHNLESTHFKGIDGFDYIVTRNFKEISVFAVQKKSPRR